MLPPTDQLTICFAHVAYRLRERFLALATGIESFEVRDGAALEQRIGEADVLVISGLWRNDLLPRAKRLRFIQSIGAGTDQFSHESLKQHGVRLASARGVNARAVSEHLMALMLALARRLPEARDNQAKRVWRGMIGDITQRGRARRQDAADRRPRTDRRSARAARQGVRHARDRHPPRPARRCADTRMRCTRCPTSRHAAAGRFRCPHLPADGGNREADRCRCARPHEAVRVSSQRGAWARGRRAGARRRARATADQGRETESCSTRWSRLTAIASDLSISTPRWLAGKRGRRSSVKSRPPGRGRVLLMMKPTSATGYSETAQHSP